MRQEGAPAARPVPRSCRSVPCAGAAHVLQAGAPLAIVCLVRALEAWQSQVLDPQPTHACRQVAARSGDMRRALEACAGALAQLLLAAGAPAPHRPGAQRSLKAPARPSVLQQTSATPACMPAYASACVRLCIALCAHERVAGQQLTVKLVPARTGARTGRGGRCGATHAGQHRRHGGRAVPGARRCARLSASLPHGAARTA